MVLNESKLSPEERTRAVEEALAEGDQVVAERYGVEIATVRVWRSRAGRTTPSQWLSHLAKARASRVHALRARLRQDLLATATLGMAELAQQWPKLSTRERRDIAATVGTLLDKFRLEAGEAMSIPGVAPDNARAVLAEAFGLDPEDRDRDDKIAAILADLRMGESTIAKRVGTIRVVATPDGRPPPEFALDS